MSQRCHVSTMRPGLISLFTGGPGSLMYIAGIAKFKKVFLNLSRASVSCLSNLSSSIVYKPATAAVVVARAGTILPALSLTVSQSIGGKL